MCNLADVKQLKISFGLRPYSAKGHNGKKTIIENNISHELVIKIDWSFVFHFLYSIACRCK